MRIYFNSMGLPKKAAKRVLNRFNTRSKVEPRLKLSVAQKMAARMLGYKSWYELEKVTSSGKFTSSLLDENVSEAEQKERIDFQAKVLGEFIPALDTVCREHALKLRVSGGIPGASGLTDNNQTQNLISGWIDPITKKDEWFFSFSQRSEAALDDVYDLQEKWESATVEQKSEMMGDLIDSLNFYRKNQPENVAVIDLYLDVILTLPRGPEDDIGIITEMADEVEKWFPSGFPLAKQFMDWNRVGNRDFLRVLFKLGECYFLAGDLDKAEKWLKLSLLTCKETVVWVKPLITELELIKSGTEILH